MKNKRILQIGAITNCDQAFDILFDSLNLAALKGVFDLNKSATIRDSIALLSATFNDDSLLDETVLNSFAAKGIQNVNYALNILNECLNLAALKGVFDINQSGLIFDSISFVYAELNKNKEAKNDGNSL
jgi:hypothetical protein